MINFTATAEKIFDNLESELKNAWYEHYLSQHDGDKVKALNELQGFDSQVNLLTQEDGGKVVISGFGESRTLFASEVSTEEEIQEAFADFFGFPEA